MRFSRCIIACALVYITVWFSKHLRLFANSYNCHRKRLELTGKKVHFTRTQYLLNTHVHRGRGRSSLMLRKHGNLFIGTDYCISIIVCPPNDSFCLSNILTFLIVKHFDIFCQAFWHFLLSSILTFLIVRSFDISYCRIFWHWQLLGRHINVPTQF